MITNPLPNRCQSLNKFVWNPYKHWVYFFQLFTQTPLRTAFHDTQRLLLEVYISNVRSVFVFFAPLMKK